jgi:hypothetical protein
MICADFLAGANLDNGDPEIPPINEELFQVFDPRATPTVLTN